MGTIIVVVCLILVAASAAVVKLRKNIAVVSISRDVGDGELTQAVENAGFKVVKIEKSDK